MRTSYDFAIDHKGQIYSCCLVRAQYEYGWEVAPSVEARDAGIERVRQEKEREAAEKEAKRQEANARRRPRGHALPRVRRVRRNEVLPCRQVTIEGKRLAAMLGRFNAVASRYESICGGKKYRLAVWYGFTSILSD